MKRAQLFLEIGLAAGTALAAVSVVGCGGGDTQASFDGPVATWPAYGNDAGGMRFSPADQIDPENVDELEIAWTYRTGDTGENRGVAFEATPILAAGQLVFCTPFNRVIALNPETGREVWTFDPKIERDVGYANQFVCRGVSQWVDESAPETARCRHRIFTATNDSRLIAIDARDGQRCVSFGDGGEVNLARGVGEFAWRGEYQITSPPAIFHDLVITGSGIADNDRLEAPSGVVRAYDARTGALRWAWDALPPDLEHPPKPVSDEPEAWRHGTANVWSVISADESLGLVYLPTGNTSPDYWAAERRGSDHYSSSVVALHGATGEVAWSFQTVHHDLWDFDVPAQPTLLTLRRNGQEVLALVQATKMGLLFVLDRRTGEPLFPIEERPVPQTDVPGEVTSPTQPIPTRPPPLAEWQLDSQNAFGFFGFDRRECREKLEALRWDGLYTPPSLQGTLMFPGAAGGSNWGGIAADASQELVVANVMNLAWSVQLIPRERFAEEARANPDIEHARQAGTPYGIRREIVANRFGLPCTPPPWGTLSAVELAGGTIRWQVPLGTIRDLLPLPLPIGRSWGTPNIGGPVVTGSGLVFVGATMDNYLRAFDLESGEELWRGRLPAAPQATPMTYRLRPESRQFVVIAAGGHDRAGTTRGDALVAFALPAAPSP